MPTRVEKAVTGLRPRMRIPDRANDAETALLRHLLYGFVPAWFIPGLLDWFFGITKLAAG